MSVGRRGRIGLFFFFVLLLPAGAMAQKESTPLPPEQKQSASYYDFDDILIPAELKLDRKNSFVYGLTKSKVGFLIFEGRIEPSSLAGFFQNNMKRDGWKLLSNFKYREYLFTFLKGDRICVITITEKTFKTLAEIRVGPIEPAEDKPAGRPSR